MCKSNNFCVYRLCLKGCAFFTYGSREEAENVIFSLHDKMTLHPAQHPLQVKFADSESARTDHKLFIGMVPKEVTEEDLRPIFQMCGNLVELSVLRGPGNISKGCAFVRFDIHHCATVAN